MIVSYTNPYINFSPFPLFLMSPLWDVCVLKGLLKENEGNHHGSVKKKWGFQSSHANIYKIAKNKIHL